MGKIWNVKQEITLLFLGQSGLFYELGDFITNLPYLFLERGAILSPASGKADFLAQPFPVGITSLKRRFHFPPFRVHFQHLVDPGRVLATAGRQPAFDQSWLFADETDVEHAEELSALPGDRKSKANESA
jgi:hypothetical protein